MDTNHPPPKEAQHDAKEQVLPDLLIWLDKCINQDWGEGDDMRVLIGRD